MKKLPFSLFGLLLCGIAFSASAQFSDSVPPVRGTWVNVHHDRYSPRGRPPEPPPTGGFWVSQDNLRKTSPVIVCYYDDQQRQLQADTLRQNRLNLKSRAIVHQLNERLASLLHNRQQPVALVRPE